MGERSQEKNGSVCDNEIKLGDHIKSISVETRLHISQIFQIHASLQVNLQAVLLDRAAFSKANIF
jgi:hypothetical protein